MVTCQICKQDFLRISPTHLRAHGLSLTSYRQQYPTHSITANSLKSRVGFSREKAIKKYGTVVGEERWAEYRKKQAASNTFEYKSKKHGITREQFNAYNKSRSSTLANFINRYGIETGTMKWNEYCKRQAYAGVTVGYFIEKYGEQIGRSMYNAVLSKKLNTLSGFVARYGRELGEIRYTQFIERRKYNSSLIVSPLSQLCLTQLHEEYTTCNPNIDSNKIYFHSKNFEYVFRDKNQCAFVDFYDANTRTVVEFYGDYWHANPALYSSDDIIRGIPVSVIRENDEKRVTHLRGLGVKNIIIIWESEYKSDPTKCIQRVINEIQRRSNN